MNFIVIGSKFLQKITILIKKITSANSKSLIFKMYKGKNNIWLIFSLTKQSAKTYKNNNNQTNLTQHLDYTIHVYNTNKQRHTHTHIYIYIRVQKVWLSGRDWRSK